MTYEALFFAWKQSRDSKKHSAGSSGTDGVSASQFAANSSARISEIVARLKRREYGFSTLRPVLIPKANSDKDRLICIPTVGDRLVQRAMLEYCHKQDPFPIRNSASFGFIRDLGPSDAIEAAIKHRETFDWCLKTDIVSFFDRIPRPYLKRRVHSFLGNHSLTPLMWSAIDCEVKATAEEARKIASLGIKRREGVRQGMPLSPLLANIALIEFDKAIIKRDIPMVRYADDLVLFFKTKDEAKSGEALVRDLLSNLSLSIPTLDQNAKTKIISRSDALEFLGRQIVFLKDANKFVAKVSSDQISKILVRLLNDYRFEKLVEKNLNFQESVLKLSRSVSSYLGIYKDVHNFEHFAADVRGQARAVISALFKEIFGEASLASVNPAGRKFLGIEVLDSVIPNSEFDV